MLSRQGMSRCLCALAIHFFVCGCLSPGSKRREVGDHQARPPAPVDSRTGQTLGITEQPPNSAARALNQRPPEPPPPPNQETGQLVLARMQGGPNAETQPASDSVSDCRRLYMRAV